MIELGEMLCEEIASRLPVEIGDKALLGALTRLGLEDRQSLMLSIGTHSISDADVMEALIPGSTLDADHHPHVPQQHRAIPIRGLTPGVALKLSECCHPDRKSTRLNSSH